MGAVHAAGCSNNSTCAPWKILSDLAPCLAPLYLKLDVHEKLKVAFVCLTFLSVCGGVSERIHLGKLSLLVAALQPLDHKDQRECLKLGLQNVCHFVSLGLIRDSV